MDGEVTIRKGFEYAKEAFAQRGVDAESALLKADAVPVSMHCWQGDDVGGFDGADSLTGGIAVTGNHPGRARNLEELQQDIRKALSLIPGTSKLNLHACYAVKNGKAVDRDAYTPREFAPWADFAKEEGLGLDFNPTYFSHPMMDGNLSLSSPDETKRRFWIEHGKRCREIALEFAKQTGKPCAVNYWMPDGFKDTCADTKLYRDVMRASLDEIFEADIDPELVPCALESKLFGIGVESFTVGSHEFYLAYAASHKVGVCMDTGHYHPTEQAYDKLSAVVPFLPYALLHISRGIRWDSDHVLIGADELEMLMREMKRGGYFAKVGMGLDYFDASINRVAAWVIGLRAFGRSLLAALLEPGELLEAYEAAEDYTSRLALTDELRNLPVSAVWDMLCLRAGVPVGADWLANVKAYERDVQAARG